MEAPRPATPLESDTVPSIHDNDNDSTLSDFRSASRQTGSVTDSVYDYNFKNGRRFHAYEAGIYMLPNDDEEQDRLDLQHHIFRISVEGKLHLAPIPKDPHHVLDIGTGTGIWAIEFANDHPTASVLGVDLSPIQPSYVPINCSFRVDNVENDWISEEKYDFIHSRAMVGGIRSWPKLFKQAFEHLKPGGYLELQDITFPTLTNKPEDSERSKFVAYGNRLLEAGKRIGLDFQGPDHWKELLEEAGFTEIHQHWVNWPVGPWAKHEKNKAIGKFTFVDFYEGMDAVKQMFIGVLGLSAEEVDQLVVEVRQELRDQKIHLYQRVCFCYARKPLET